MHDDPAVSVAVHGMSEHDVGRVLGELEVVVSAIRAEHRIAAQAAECAEAAAEELRETVGDLGVRPTYPRPNYALVVHREEVIRFTETHLQTAREELTAWWAHAATLALLASLAGTPVTAAAMATTGPWHFLSPDDRTRMGSAEELTGEPDPREPEEWRQHLWGAAWSRHRVPALPTPAALSAALIRAGVPGEAITELVDALGAVEEAIQAMHAVSVLEEQPLSEQAPDLPARRLALWQLYDDRIDRIAAYAAAVTRRLPEVRSAVARAPSG